jgi:hypothetical protein
MSTAFDIVGPLKGVVNEDDHLIPLDQLTTVFAFYWSEALKYLKEKAKEDEVALGGEGGGDTPPKPFKEQDPKKPDEEEEEEEAADSRMKEEERQNNAHYVAMIEPSEADFAAYLKA